MSYLRKTIGIDSRKQLDEKFLSFVQSLGMLYNEDGDATTLSPKLRTGFLDIRMNKVVSGQVENFTFRLFSMYYKWMKHAANVVLVLELSLNRNVPSMLILSLEDEFYQTLVPAEFSAGVEVRLEGDFNSHFQLFVQEGAEDEIRQLLTPDLIRPRAFFRDLSKRTIR